MILMYHKVYPESPTMWWVDVDSFYRQMCELKCRKVVYLDDYDPADPNQVVITFDGVYQNVRVFAAPILRKFGYPFELFVTGNYIGRDNSFDPPEPKAEFTSIEDLTELTECGGRLQWHSKTHRNLKEVFDEDVISSELTIPEEVKRLDDKGFRWFGYPHGDFNAVLVERTKRLFKGGISCIQGNDSDLFTLNRVTVTNETTFKKAPVTLIITSYNYGSYLIEAIESALRQTRPVDEIIIADDCSTDNTMEIGLEYQKKYPELIKYFRNEQNIGIVKNFNKAVSIASGDYLCFLGADNRFRSDYIEKTSDVLDSDDHIAIAYTDFALFGPRAKIMYQERFKDDMKGPIREDYYYIVNFPEFNETAKQRLGKENIFHGSSMFRKLAFHDVGGYKDEKDMPEDWNLFARMIKKGWSAKRVPHPVLEYRQHSREQSQLKVISNAELSYYKEQHKLLRHEFTQKTQAMNQLHQQISQRDRQLAELDRQLKETAIEHDRLNTLLSLNSEELLSLKQLSHEKDLKIGIYDTRIAQLEKEIREKENLITNILNSMSWRITAPLRKVHEFLTKCSTIRQKKETEGRLSALKLIRNISHITKTYNFRQAIPNIREYGLKTFLRNARMEFTRENVTDISIYQKTSNGPDSTGNKTSNEIQIGPQDTCKKTNAYFNFLFEANNCREKDYVPISYPNLAESDIKLIAFYLPQFHPIPENDEWWGKGFTEWTNVSKAIPQFIGHYQPRLPGELGFYDLRLPEVQKRQIELARQYGIYGFCFHFYWFKSGQVLERPLEQFLENKDLDFPFCINWANESWSRRWDGRDKDILLEQNHSAEDDIEFIKYVSRLFSDSRYIRIQGRPLLIIYRPSLFPNLRETAAIWREYCRKNGIGEIYLALTHSFEYVDPEKIGFDAAIEFAPNTFLLKPINDEIEFTNPDFNGIVYDYNSAVNYSKIYPMPDYKKFRCITPGWDNEARKPGSGSIFHRASPQSYKEWLEYLCTYTRQNFSKGERFIFINAWNEWAEGAYLEPDRKYGYAYLHETAEVLASFPEKPTAVPGKWKILFVSHDACRGGAQLVFLNIISWIKKYTSIDLKILCLDRGEWLSRFRELGDTVVLSELRKERPSEEALIDRLLELNDGPPDLIYGNSVAAGREYRLLRRLNIPIITHFHELEMSIKKYAGDWINDVLKYSSHIIACSGAVRENLAMTHKVDRSKITTVFECITPDSSIQILNNAEKCQEREKLGLEKDKFIIFGCGIGMVFRKGADLFIEVARILSRNGLKNFHFYWIGDFDVSERSDRYGRWADHLSSLKKDGLKEHVTFLGLKDNPREYLRTGDIFLLPSREDPFPLVTLEAAECGLPVICFADAGGIPEFVEEDAGFVVPYENAEAMAEKVALLVDNENLRRTLGVQAREKLLSRFTVEQTSPQIFSICRSVAQKKPAVSVIVPNYNHARYLPRRLDSIFGQTFRDFEVVLLDDASTDDSMKVLEQYAHHADVQVVKNKNNTGSPCTQWLKGIDLAKADFFWVAESDDACEPEFLETLIREFRNPSVMLAYADSFIIDENDRVTGDYLNCEYLTSLSETKWRKNYQLSATAEINDGLGVKNTILNISAVLFRKFDFENNFRKVIEGMRIAGDWYFIAHAIRNGNVHYVSKKLNYHRRHSESVIGKTVADKKTEDFFREFYTVQQFIFHNYKLADGFHEKWEKYLRKQWNDFYPNRPFEDIKKYYPFDEMKEMHFLKCKTI